MPWTKRRCMKCHWLMCLGFKGWGEHFLYRGFGQWHFVIGVLSRDQTKYSTAWHIFVHYFLQKSTMSAIGLPLHSGRHLESSFIESLKKKYPNACNRSLTNLSVVGLPNDPANTKNDGDKRTQAERRLSLKIMSNSRYTRFFKLFRFLQRRRELYIRLPLPQNIKLKSCENKINDVCRQQKCIMILA